MLLAAAAVLPAATLEVGPGKRFSKPCQAFAAAAFGDTIEIADSGNYDGDVCVITTANLTARGVGGNRAHIRAAGRAADDNGIWVLAPTVQRFTAENIEFSGASSSAKNGAGIWGRSGASLTVRNCHFHDNQNGILTGNVVGPEFVIEFSIFENNGADDGYSHNVYIGLASKLTFRGNYSARARRGQLLKTRAVENYILYNRLSQENGNGSWEVDISNGGIAYVIGNVIQQGQQSENRGLLAFAPEGVDPQHPTQTLFAVNNTFLTVGNANEFVFVNRTLTTPVVIRNNIMAGGGPVTNQTNAVQEGNYVGNAGFLNADGFDFTLRPGSVAIDAGVSPGADRNFSLSPAGMYRHPACIEARNNVGIVDIGAYEYGAPPGQPDGPERCKQAFAPSEVANAASFARDAFAPGMIATMFGTGFADQAIQATAAPWPAQLGGVRVTVNQLPAPTYFVNPGQVNFQIPYGLDLGDAVVLATVNGVAKTPARITLREAAPGIFLHSGQQAIAQNPDGSLNTTSNGVEAGGYVTVYLTGQGRLTRFIDTGEAARPLPLAEAALPSSATIGGKPANILFLGMTPGLVAVAQANIVIPEDLAPGTYPLVITIGGVPSNTAQLTVIAKATP